MSAPPSRPSLGIAETYTPTDSLGTDSTGTDLPGVSLPAIALDPTQPGGPATTDPTNRPAPVTSLVHRTAPTASHGTRQAPVVCSSLQAQLDAAPAGSTLRLTGCTFSTGATISKSLTILGGTIRVPSGSTGLRVTASNVTISGVTLAGPNGSQYRGDEFGVYALGSSNSPIRSLTVRNSNIGNFGDVGIYAQHVTSLLVSGNTIHDVVYAGILVYSGQGGRIQANLVERIGVHGASANENNAYGIALSDQGGAPTSDFVVTANTVQDIPTWHALDTHGGQRISFTNNTVRRASRGIFITSSSSSRATNVIVSGNKLLGPAPVSANLEALTTYNTVAVTITGNTITGWGGSTIEDYEGMSSGLVVKGNQVS